MRARNKTRLRILVRVTLISAALGAVLGGGADPLHLAVNAFIAGSVGCLIALFEMVLQGPAREPLQAVPFGAVFALRVLAYGVVFAVAPTLAVDLAATLSPSRAAGGMFGIGIGDSILIALAFNTVFAARALLGPRTLLAFVTGRYHRPRREERVVLFLDMHGSTGLAERLGDLEFHRLLNRIGRAAADPVAEAGGEIYRYVGDEIIVTWKRSEAGIAALECLFAIEDALARRRTDYVAKFGAVPRLRGALHAGPVVVGEIGDAKREIVILGDTMNTAARMVEVCRGSGRDYVVSAAALDAIGTVSRRLRKEPLGMTRLRGKEEQIELFGIAREATRRPSATRRRETVPRGSYRNSDA